MNKLNICFVEMSQPQDNSQVSHASPSKAWPVTILLLRLLIFLFLVISIILLTTNKVTLILADNFSVDVHFKDVYAYRYMLSASTIVLAYTLKQIPVAIYFISTGKQIIGSFALAHYNLIADKVAALLLASGVGAGFGATIDLKELADGLEALVTLESSFLYPTNSFVDANNSLHEIEKLDKFFRMANVANGFVLMAFVCMTMLSIISSYALTNKG